MLGDALQFPRSGDDWLPTVIIGGVLSILGVLILPALVIQGYLVRVLRAGARDNATVPSFTEWGRLLVDGLKILLVSLGYGLAVVVPLVVLSVVLAVTNGLGAEAGGPGLLAGLIGLGVGIAFVLLSVAVGYVVPAAMANFAIQGRLGAAFDVGTVAQGAFTVEYAIAWLLGLLVAVVGGLLGAVLSALVVGIFLLFYVQVSVYYLWGRGFAAGLGHEPGAPQGPTTVSA
jgi:hypothetical protein